MAENQERESVKVLRECIELQLKKSQDYQNPNSNVKQAMHYRRGIDTIYDIIHGKMIRIQSLIESGNTPNHESIEDSFKDLINYASFAVSYLRGKMEGQDPNRDMFNEPKSTRIFSVKPTITFSNLTYSTSDKITLTCLASELDPDNVTVRTEVATKVK
jgi:hypothetical protein